MSTNVSKWEGAKQRKVTLTGEEAARLRSMVGDDPIPTPQDQIPCESCGVGVPDLSPPPVGDCSWCGYQFPVGRDGGISAHDTTLADGSGTQCPGSDRPRGDKGQGDPYGERYGLCDPCTAIRERAEHYVTEHPLLARQIGPQLAQERIEGVLHGLDLLGQEVNVDLGLLLNRMTVATHGLGFRKPFTTSARCNSRPWDHVTPSQRANLGKAYADVLRDRILLNKPPVDIACPSIACAFCGVPSFKVAAIALGSTKVWQQIDVLSQSLGGPDRPDLIRCHVCPPCDAAIDQAHSVGPTAREIAVLVHVERISKEKADLLRRRLIDNPMSDDFPPSLPGWRALPVPRVPNAEPWGHLRRLIESL